MARSRKKRRAAKTDRKIDSPAPVDAERTPPAGLAGFLVANKRWWLLPLLFVLGFVSLLIAWTVLSEETVVETGLGTAVLFL